MVATFLDVYTVWLVRYLMIIQKLKNDKWKCLYCQRIFDKKEDAYEHETKHEIVLVPMAKEDLNRLLLFIFTKEDELLRENLISMLKRYNSTAALRR